MKSILVFAFVLAVAGGVIAYIGDRLGTYVGKKRISLIGLRPRHTATLYTTVSGGVISVLTLLVLVGLDRTFQRALLEGPQLVYENSHYRQQIKAEKEKVKTGREQTQQVTLLLAQVRGQLAPVQKELLSAQRSLQSSRGLLSLRQKQLDTAQGQLSGTKNSLATTGRQLGLARQEVMQAKTALVSAEASVTAARQEVGYQQKHLQALATQGAMLASKNSGLQTLNSRLMLQNRRLTNQGVSLAQRVDASHYPLIFQTNQEVGRYAIKTDQPVTVIQNQLNTFLEYLGLQAEKRGGRHGVNGRAVVIAIPRSDGGDYHPLNLLDEQNAIKVLAQNIAGGATTIPSVVVVARAATNTFLGEQTMIDLHPYDNILIYAKGAVVATTTVDGKQSVPQILTALQAFLSGQVRPNVLHQGLIPETDPQTGSPSAFTVDGATFLTLAQQIERSGMQVQVTAVAGEETYSNGPLHLRFSVSPLAPPPPAAAGTAPGGRS